MSSRPPAARPNRHCSESASVIVSINDHRSVEQRLWLGLKKVSGLFSQSPEAMPPGRLAEKSPDTFFETLNLPRQDGEAEAANGKVGIRLERSRQGGDSPERAPPDRVGCALVQGQRRGRQAAGLPKAGPRHRPPTPLAALRRVRVRHLWGQDVFLREDKRQLPLLRGGEGEMLEPCLLSAGADRRRRSSRPWRTRCSRSPAPATRC